MIDEKLLRGLADLSTGILTMAAASGDSPALKRRSTTIKDKDRLGAKKEKLADAAKESKNLRIAHHLASLIPHRHHELDHPNACICEEIPRSESLGFVRKKIKKRDRLVPIASVFPAKVSTETRRPTGASNSQRP